MNTRKQPEPAATCSLAHQADRQASSLQLSTAPSGCWYFPSACNHDYVVFRYAAVGEGARPRRCWRNVAGSTLSNAHCKRVFVVRRRRWCIDPVTVAIIRRMTRSCAAAVVLANSFSSSDSRDFWGLCAPAPACIHSHTTHAHRTASRISVRSLQQSNRPTHFCCACALC